MITRPASGWSLQGAGSIVLLVVAGHLASLGGLSGCGGGGENKVTSQALVADGPSACRVHAEGEAGPCLISFGYFKLFDAAGNEIPITGNDFSFSGLDLGSMSTRDSFTITKRICRKESGEIVLTTEPVSCSMFPTPPPLQDVSCEEFSRVEIFVTSCD